MTIRNLDAIFKPTSVAVIGASEKPGSLGRILFENLLHDFTGEVLPVNPGHSELLDRTTYGDVAALPSTPDFAVIATPPDTVPGLVAALAEKGTRGICVITAGFSSGAGAAGQARRQAMLDAARPHLLRIVGPNCVGLQVPGIGLNASFASVFPKPGNIGFIAQSGAVITAVLDWAAPRGIGFSHVVSLGDMADVDFGDLLDYLADDPGTESILMYMEAITNARKFMSAARRAARTKPVIVVKGGRQAAGARAAASHTGALAGIDAVYDAAFRRAGVLRVLTLEELFDVVETLATARMPQGDSLTILTNGGGLGVLAADALMAEGGQLTTLTEDTLAKLDAVLPTTWSRSNPVDIIGDAKGPRYAAALEVLLNQPESESLLILNCPTALASSDEVATAVMDALPLDLERTVLTSWTGDHSTRTPRSRIQARGLPVYDTPEDAVHAFVQMVTFRRSQRQLLEVPPSLSELVEPEQSDAQAAISSALESARSWLTEPEAKAVLSAYGIPVVPTHIAEDAAVAAAIAKTMDGPLALKILSPDITHKSDVGGVSLNVAKADAATAAQALLDRVAAAQPRARLTGVTIQPMVERHGAHELILGMINDAQFGPVLLFGHGGTAVEVLDDKALALPPLNLMLAHDLITRTRIYRLLKGYRDVAPINFDALAMVLVRLSQLVVDLPQIEELDINPLLVDSTGLIALDARIRVAEAPDDGMDRLAILPYPKALEASITTPDGSTFFLRPVLPEDEPRLLQAFADVPTVAAARFTQIDYDRQMALVLTDPGIPGTQPIYGVARLEEDPDRFQAQLRLAVASGNTGRGLGSALLKHALAHARDRGVRQVVTDELDADDPLALLCRARGFSSSETALAEHRTRLQFDL